MPNMLSSIFCDDVRQEAGNKLSYMGVYINQMLVPGFPFDLSRLFVIMRAMLPPGDQSRSLKFVVMINDDVVAEMDMPESELGKPLPSAPQIAGASDLQMHRVLQTIFGLPPMRIEQACVIRTRIITDTETVRGDSLVIEVAPQPETTGT